MRLEIPIVFSSSKHSFLQMLVVGGIYFICGCVLIFVMIHGNDVLSIIRVFCLVISLLCAYGVLLAFTMLYKVSFFEEYVQLDYYFLFFKQKAIIRYNDLKIVCRPRFNYLSFYKKRLIRFGISTSLNKYWKKEQILQMVAILTEHKVTVRFI